MCTCAVFILGWKQLGFAQRFGAHIVCYADDLSIFGRSPARQMLTAVERMMNQLQLPINHSKTRCLRCPQEPMEFLGYRIGWNYRDNGSAYIGTRPSKASVQSLCRKVSEQTSRKYGTDGFAGKWLNVSTGCCPVGRTISTWVKSVLPIRR